MNRSCPAPTNPNRVSTYQGLCCSGWRNEWYDYIDILKTVWNISPGKRDSQYEKNGKNQWSIPTWYCNFSTHILYSSNTRLILYWRHLDQYLSNYIHTYKKQLNFKPEDILTIISQNDVDDGLPGWLCGDLLDSSSNDISHPVSPFNTGHNLTLHQCPGISSVTFSLEINVYKY